MPTKRQREGTYIPRFIKCAVQQCTKAATENKLCDGHRVMHQCSKVKDPERWAAIARTHFQEGLMALTRAVAQPTFF